MDTSKPTCDPAGIFNLSCRIRQFNPERLASEALDNFGKSAWRHVGEAVADRFAAKETVLTHGKGIDLIDDTLKELAGVMALLGIKLPVLRQLP